jgi:hypothetical protein
MSTLHPVSTLSGAQLEAATVAVFKKRGGTVSEDPVLNSPRRFYAALDGFDGQHGASEFEAVLRFGCFETYGDQVPLGE